MSPTDSKADLDASYIRVSGAEAKKKSWYGRLKLKLSSPVYREKFYYMLGLYLTSFFSVRTIISLHLSHSLQREVLLNAGPVPD